MNNDIKFIFEPNEGKCKDCMLNPLFGGVTTLGVRLICGREGKLKVELLADPLTPDSQPAANIGKSNCNTAYSKFIQMLDQKPVEEIFSSNKFIEV